MKIGIIGAGAVGLLAGSYLGREHDVHMFVRHEEQKHQLEKEGILCDLLKKPTRIKAHLTEEIGGGFDLWMVAVKQKDLEEVLKMNLPQQTPVLFLQNGMGHLEKLSHSPLTSLVGVVEHGALKKNHHKVSHTGRGNFQIATFSRLDSSSLEAIISELHTPDFPIYFREDYQEMLQSKLMINNVINPLTALFQQPNRCIGENPYITELARQICEEACMVLGLEFSEQWDKVLDIVDKTGNNHSSMMKDLASGNRTEIDSISGYILKRSSHRLPYHQFIVRAIHAIELEKGARSYE